MVAITRQPHALVGGILPAEWPDIIQAKMNFQQSVIHFGRDAVRNRCRGGRAPPHEHNMPGATASVRGPRPSSTAARAMARPRMRDQADRGAIYSYTPQDIFTSPPYV